MAVSGLATCHTRKLGSEDVAVTLSGAEGLLGQFPSKPWKLTWARSPLAQQQVGNRWLMMKRGALAHVLRVDGVLHLLVTRGGHWVHQQEGQGAQEGPGKLIRMGYLVSRPWGD